MASRRPGVPARGVARDGDGWMTSDAAVIHTGDDLAPGEWVTTDPVSLASLVLSGSRSWRVLTTAAGEPVWAGCEGVSIRTVHRVALAESIAAEEFRDTSPLAVAGACTMILGETRRAWSDAVGAPCPSLSSMAMPELRTLRVSAALDGLARSAYYPGRVEVIRVRAEGKVRSYDLGSAYAWAVRQGVPGAYIGRARGFRAERSDERCLYYLSVRCSQRRVGVLPFRTPAGRVVYPHGAWEGWYPRPEAEAALDRGVAECTETLRYAAWYPWQAVIDRAWRLRDDAPKGSIRRAALKLILVSLYGHLAAPRVGRVLLVRPREIQDGDERLGAHVWAREVPRTPPGHGAAAAYLTSAVRARILAELDRGAYYCATDAVHVGDCHTIATSTDLGGWRLDHEADGGVWLAPGTYQLGPDDAPRRRMGGVPREVQLDLWARGTVDAARVSVDLATGSPVRYTTTLRLARHDTSRTLPDAEGWTMTRNVEDFSERKKEKDYDTHQ